MLDAFGYQQTIARLDKAGVLYAVLGDFADIELHPDVVSNEAMGYVFEELLRKFSEMSNETAGEHYTPREVIRLMVDLLFDEDADALAGAVPGAHRLRPRRRHRRHAHHGRPAAARAQPGRDRGDVRAGAQPRDLGDRLLGADDARRRARSGWRRATRSSTTHSAGTRFDYMLANPPYGVDWKAYADPIKAEAATAGGSNRFHAGLPRISDGSFLFLQHMISKMKPASAAGGGSRLAIVLSGSPLFSGGAGSGESRSAAGSSRTTCSKASSACPTRCSTTPASPPTSGS